MKSCQNFKFIRLHFNENFEFFVQADFVCDVVTWFNGVCNEAPMPINEQKYDDDMAEMQDSIQKLKGDKHDIHAEWQIPVSDEEGVSESLKLGYH